MQRYVRAVGPFGLVPERSDPDAADSLIAPIVDRIAPAGLPADIEWFWRHWMPSSFGHLTGYPHFTELEFVLHVLNDDETWPASLVPVAYESHGFLGVELEYPDSSAGRVYYYAYADDGHRLRARSLAEMLDVVVDAIEDGEIDERGGFVLLDADVDELCRARLDAAGVPAADRGPFDPSDSLTWPPAWRRLAGIDDAARSPVGASHSVASLIAAVHASRGAVTATISGRVVRSGGSADGDVLAIDDGTGVVDVYVPRAVPRFGQSADARYEFDVVATAGAGGTGLMDVDGDHAAASEAALAGDVDAAARAVLPIAAVIHGDHPVVATAIRPL